MLLYYLFWMLMGFILHFYIIFGTNLLTGCPTQIAVFLPILGFRRKGISNGVQTEWNLRECDFLKNVIQETWSVRQETIEEGTRQGACLPPSWAPCCSTDVLLPPIYIHEPRKHPGAPRKPNSTAATFCTREIPSWGLNFPELHRRGHRSRRASTSTPWPLRWCLSSLVQTFGSIASSKMASSLSLNLNTKFSLILLEIYSM